MQQAVIFAYDKGKRCDSKNLEFATRSDI